MEYVHDRKKVAGFGGLLLFFTCFSRFPENLKAPYDFNRKHLTTLYPHMYNKAHTCIGIICAFYEKIAGCGRNREDKI